jgi:hypothetical protein
MEIKVKYSSIDGVRTVRTFSTLQAARQFAHHCVGAHPEMGSTYAVSGDGIGKIEASGVPLADLFKQEGEQ